MLVTSSNFSPLPRMFFTLLKTNFKLIFSSTGQRPASYCHGVVSVTCASVNFSFKKLLLRNYGLDFYQISQECSLGGPFSNPSNNSVPWRILVAMATKLKKKKIKISSSQATNWIALLFCRNVP